MKKVLRLAGYFFLVLLVVVAGLVIYVSGFLPGIGVKDLRVEITPEKVERGRYLANHVTVCIDCHSQRDWTKFSGPVIPGTEGQGGEKFDQTLGFPGAYYAPNITPHGLRNWSDGEIFRAITSGVGKDGRALFPIMPYHNYGKMSEEDITSIIAYIRTLPAVESTVPPSESDFPMNLIINTIPQEASLVSMPETGKIKEYGRYLVNAAGCMDCHTPFENGSLKKEMAFAGGRVFPLPSGTLVSPNITPDKETGIGNWDRERFLMRFKMYSSDRYSPHSVTAKDFNTIMPWTMYAEMTEADLTAIYDFLMDLEPVKNDVR